MKTILLGQIVVEGLTYNAGEPVPEMPDELRNKFISEGRIGFLDDLTGEVLPTDLDEYGSKKLPHAQLLSIPLNNQVGIKFLRENSLSLENLYFLKERLEDMLTKRLIQENYFVNEVALILNKQIKTEEHLRLSAKTKKKVILNAKNS